MVIKKTFPMLGVTFYGADWWTERAAAIKSNLLQLPALYKASKICPLHIYPEDGN